MTDNLVNLMADGAVEGNILAELRWLKAAVIALQNNEPIVEDLSELSPDMGEIRAGAFYAGTGTFEEEDFVGMAMVYPSIEYPSGSGDYWNLLGLNSAHELQVGIEADTGELLWGGGVGRLNKDGLIVTEGVTDVYASDPTPNGITWVDAEGTKSSELITMYIDDTDYRGMRGRVIRETSGGIYFEMLSPTGVSEGYIAMADNSGTVQIGLRADITILRKGYFRYRHDNTDENYLDIQDESDSLASIEKVGSGATLNIIAETIDLEAETAVFIKAASDPVLKLKEGSNTNYLQLTNTSSTEATIEKVGSGATLNLTASDVVVNGFLNIPSAGTLTIASGVVTATGSFHSVDTEGSGAADNLDTINGGVVGDILILRSVTGTRDVTLKDGTGNLALAGDFVLDNANDRIMLLRGSSNWIEICRSNNA